MSSNPREDSPGGPRFATTRWSLVLQAKGRGDAPPREALNMLLSHYWHPIYAYLRRRGHADEDAQDLTQAFFERFLEKDYLADVRRERGRFRSFLLVALEHFLANEWDKARALKRGGGARLFSLDLARSGGFSGMEPAHELTPERVFERRWAVTVLDRAMLRFEEALRSEGRGEEIEVLRPFLTGDAPRGSYEEASSQLGRSVGALKVAVHRLRRRFGEALRAEIAETVEDPAQVDDELRCLREALR